MDNIFKNSLVLKIDKKAGLAHLSVKTSDYKVEVFKVSIADIGSVLMQFSEAMRDQDGPDEIIIEPKIDNNNQEDTGMES
jgi:hypothetical protein